MLPYLSRYMGHASFDSTYTTFTPRPTSWTPTTTSPASQDLLPEVGFG